MSFAKLDDRMPHHRKVRALEPGVTLAAYGLYVASIQYCQHYETDGRIQPGDLHMIVPTVPRPPRRLIAELVRVGLWDEHPDGGWAVHDFLDHYPTAVVRAKWRREAGRPAGRPRARARETETETETRDQRPKPRGTRRGEVQEGRTKTAQVSPPPGTDRTLRQ